jgi:hypothetical protein
MNPIPIPSPVETDRETYVRRFRTRGVVKEVPESCSA